MTNITNTADPAQTSPARQAATGSWENEGGTLAAPLPSDLPPGIEALTQTYYRVGRYTYLSLADAMAEHNRMSASQQPI